MGYSAGAMSVALHLLSPMSRNLFHRAFLMSGGILPQAKSPTSQLNLFKKLASFIGCNEIDNLYECVKRGDTRNITDSLRKVFEFGWDNPVYPWLPIIESKNDDENQFIDQDPMQMLQAGKFNPVPIMISTTKNEISSSAMYLMEHRELLKEWLNDFHRVGPICLEYEANETITAAIKQRYVTHDLSDRLDDNTDYSTLFDRIAQCFSDGLINFPAYRFAEITKRFTDVYYMKFQFHGSYSGFKCNSSIEENLCHEINEKRIVEHCDDLQYIFTSKGIPKIIDESSTEGQIVTKYTKLLSSFAKNGYPYYGPEIDLNNTKYNYKDTYVQFDTRFEIDRVPFEDAKLWDNLFPIMWNDNV